jgi:hypothetical protein
MIKKLLVIILILAGAGNAAFAQDLNFQAKQQLQQFKLKAKLKAESGETNFRGLSKPELQPKLNSILNVVADDFIKTLNGASRITFQDDIRLGLTRFNPYYADLDTEDKTRICIYFEELMDNVGLENSGNILNRRLNGLDPSEK